MPIPLPPGSVTQPHTKISNGCTVHRFETSTAYPQVCTDGTAYLENDNFARGENTDPLAFGREDIKGAEPIPPIPAIDPAVGRILTPAKINEIRTRLNTEQQVWGFLPDSGGLAVGDNEAVSQVIDRNLLNAIINRLNAITGATGAASTGLLYNHALMEAAPLVVIDKGTIIRAADWKTVITRFNSVKDGCVCHRDCSCNWVCNAYQNCKCNSYYNPSDCTYSENIVDNTGGLVF